MPGLSGNKEEGPIRPRTGGPEFKARLGLKSCMAFERGKLRLKPLCERAHDLTLSSMLQLEKKPFAEGPVTETARRIIAARNKKSPVILMMGGHVIRSGTQRYIIDLMKRGFINCLAMNGSCVIHDYEFSLIGATTESVARYIKDGQFGLWKETGKINDIINEAFKSNPASGYGFAIGAAISQGDFPHKDISLLRAAYELKMPATVHIGIGYDIIHEHPNFDPAASATLSYNDFLALADILAGLEGGVVMNLGTAVMGPEVFLKALSMARNKAHQEAREIKRFTAVVGDLHDFPPTVEKEPPKETPNYYFRPWKTLLVRTVAEGGESFYIKGDHRDTIPALWSAIDEYEKTYCLR